MSGTTRLIGSLRLSGIAALRPISDKLALPSSQSLTADRIRIIFCFVENVQVRIESENAELHLWDILWDTLKEAGPTLHPQLFGAGSLWVGYDGMDTARNLNPAWSPRPGFGAENHTRQINLGDQTCPSSVSVGMPR